MDVSIYLEDGRSETWHNVSSIDRDIWGGLILSDEEGQLAWYSEKQCISWERVNA